MREKQKRIVKLLALQERRLTVEAAKCASLEGDLSELSQHMQNLVAMLERDDPRTPPFAEVILNRLRTVSQRRDVTRLDLDHRLEIALELKRQIKRVEKAAERIEKRLRADDEAKEKRAVLEQCAIPRDVSAP